MKCTTKPKVREVNTSDFVGKQNMREYIWYLLTRRRVVRNVVSKKNGGKKNGPSEDRAGISSSVAVATL